jgi:hypothetical protein
MPKSRASKRLSRDHRAVLQDLGRWLLAALEGFGEGLVALGVDPAPLSPITLALVSALSTFWRSRRVRDPASVALGDARAAMIAWDVELALHPCGHAHGEPDDATGGCEVSDLRDVGAQLAEALEAAGEVLAFLQENPTSPILRADCVRAMAGVQERSARTQAVVRVMRAARVSTRPPACPEPN